MHFLKPSNVLTCQSVFFGFVNPSCNQLISLFNCLFEIHSIILFKHLYFLFQMQTMKLQSSDGDTFEVDVEIAKQSVTIKTMLEDLGMYFIRNFSILSLSVLTLIIFELTLYQM